MVVKKLYTNSPFRWLCAFFLIVIGGSAFAADSSRLSLAYSSGEIINQPQSKDFIWKTDLFAREQVTLLDHPFPSLGLLRDTVEYSMGSKDYQDLLAIYKSPLLPQWLATSGARHHISPDNSDYETRFFVRGLALVYFYEEFHKIKEPEFFKTFERFAKASSTQARSEQSHHYIGYGEDIMPLLLEELMRRPYEYAQEFEPAIRAFSSLNEWAWYHFMERMRGQSQLEFAPAQFLQNFFASPDTPAEEVLRFVETVFSHFIPRGSSLGRLPGNPKVGLEYINWQVQVLDAARNIFIYRDDRANVKYIEGLKERIVANHLVGTSMQYPLNWLTIFVRDQYAEIRLFKDSTENVFQVSKVKDDVGKVSLQIFSLGPVKDYDYRNLESLLMAGGQASVLRSRGYVDIKIYDYKGTMVKKLSFGPLICMDLFAL